MDLSYKQPVLRGILLKCNSKNPYFFSFAWFSSLYMFICLFLFFNCQIWPLIGLFFQRLYVLCFFFLFEIKGSMCLFGHFLRYAVRPIYTNLQQTQCGSYKWWSSKIENCKFVFLTPTPTPHTQRQSQNERLYCKNKVGSFFRVWIFKPNLMGKLW